MPPIHSDLVYNTAIWLVDGTNHGVMYVIAAELQEHTFLLGIACLLSTYLEKGEPNQPGRQAAATPWPRGVHPRLQAHARAQARSQGAER
jgi:hypothetical protein